MQASLNSTAVMQYRSLQSLESKLLLRKLLEAKEPMEYKGHLAMYARSSYIHSTSNPLICLDHQLPNVCHFSTSIRAPRAHSSR